MKGSLLLTIALLLCSSTKASMPLRAATYTNLDTLAKTFTEALCLKLNRQSICYDQVDLYGAINSDRKVSFDSDVTFNHTVAEYKTVDPQINNKTYTNAANKDAEFSYSDASTKTFDFGWRITDGLDMDSQDINVQTTAFNASDAFPDLSSMTIDLDDTTTNQWLEYNKTFTVKTTVTVSANKKAIVYHKVFQNVTFTNWTANVTIRGCVAIKFSETLPGGESISYYYVHEVFKSESKMTCGWDSQKTMCNRSYCIYTVKGDYAGPISYYDHVTQEETDITLMESNEQLFTF